MAEPMTEERLEIVLASMADDLVIPSNTGTSGSIPEARAARRHLRLLTIAAAVVLVTVAATTAAPVRRAVADVVDWLDIGSTRIEHVDPEDGDPSHLLPVDAGLPTVPAPHAQALLGRPLPTVAALGEPATIAAPPEGGVLLVWERDATTLWITPTADPAEVRTRKLLDEIDTVEPVTQLGEAAVFIEGDHVLTTPLRRVAADSVLLWIDDGLEYRLESDAGLDTMLAIGRSIPPG